MKKVILLTLMLGLLGNLYAKDNFAKFVEFTFK